MTDAPERICVHDRGNRDWHDVAAIRFDCPGDATLFVRLDVVEAERFPHNPEWDGEVCQRCGQDSHIGFSVPDEVWTAVTGLGENGVWCVGCFTREAERKGIAYDSELMFYTGGKRCSGCRWCSDSDLAGLIEKASKLPWFFGEKLTASENHKGFYIGSAQPVFTLADVRPGDEDGNIGRANAQLIVAAVNALARLEASTGAQKDG